MHIKYLDGLILHVVLARNGHRNDGALFLDIFHHEALHTYKHVCTIICIQREACDFGTYRFQAPNPKESPNSRVSKAIDMNLILINEKHDLVRRHTVATRALASRREIDPPSRNQHKRHEYSS